MPDNDLIRRGDALECFMGLDRIGDIMDAIAALPAVTVGVRPLVWVEGMESGRKVWDALDYQIIAYPEEYFFLLVGVLSDSAVRVASSYPTLEAAKAAAQADYEARILATLDLTPAPDAAAIREAAEASPNHAYRVGYAAGRAAALREAADLLFTVAGEKGATKTPQGRTAQYYARRILALIPKGGDGRRVYMGQIMAECDCPREAECQAAGRCIAEGCPSEPRL